MLGLKRRHKEFLPTYLDFVGNFPTLFQRASSALRNLRLSALEFPQLLVALGKRLKYDMICIYWIIHSFFELPLHTFFRPSNTIFLSWMRLTYFKYIRSFEHETALFSEKWEKEKLIRTISFSWLTRAPDLGFNFKGYTTNGKAAITNGTRGLGRVLSPRSRCIHSYLQLKTRLKWQRQLSKARFAKLTIVHLNNELIYFSQKWNASMSVFINIWV